MAKYGYVAPQGMVLENGASTYEIKSFAANPFADKVLAALNDGKRPCDLRIDVERDLPDSLVREFLIQSRRIQDWAVAAAGSSIRDLLLGREDRVGDIDIAVGRPAGEQSAGIHMDVYGGIVKDMRKHFDTQYRGQPFSDMIHFSSPHWLSKNPDGRWVFHKQTGAAQYTQDYFGLLNTGEIVDPYGGAKDMLDGVVRLDYQDKKFLEDTPSMSPESVAFSKGHRLTYNTVVRGLFPQYKWGHRFHPDTEREFTGHTPWFYCSDYELEMLKRLSLWAPDTIRYVTDLKRYGLTDGLREAAASSEKVQTLTAKGQANELRLRAGTIDELGVEDVEYVTKAERIGRFLETLSDRIRKPLQHEITK